MVERGHNLALLVLVVALLSGTICGYGGEIASSLRKMDEHSRPVSQVKSLSLLRVCAVLFHDMSTRFRQVEDHTFAHNLDSLMYLRTPVPMP